MIKRRVRFPSAAFVVMAAVMCALTAAAGSWAYHTRFVANSCNTNPPQYTSYFTRDGSSTVALYAQYDS
jgi:hypothetical protein